MFEWLYTWADRVRSRERRKGWSEDQARGRDGEDIAHRHLRRAGFTIVARNYRTRGGASEVDLIAVDGQTTVFVEVKSRESAEFGAPDRAVGLDKKRHIFHAAAEYLRRLGRPPGPVRFDIVSIVFKPRIEVRHDRDAFRPH